MLLTYAPDLVLSGSRAMSACQTLLDGRMPQPCATGWTGVELGVGAALEGALLGTVPVARLLGEVADTRDVGELPQAATTKRVAAVHKHTTARFRTRRILLAESRTRH